MPKATSAVSPIGVPPEELHSPWWLITICEMKQGRAWTSAWTSPTLCGEPVAVELEDEVPPKKSVSERAGQISASAQLGLAPENPWRASTRCWNSSAQEITAGSVGSFALIVTFTSPEMPV